MDEDGLYKETRSLLRKKNHEAYRALYAPTEEDAKMMLPEEMEEDINNDGNDDNNDIYGMTCDIEPERNYDELEDMMKNADTIFGKWIMSVYPPFHKYVFKSTQLLKKAGNIKS